MVKRRCSGLARDGRGANGHKYPTWRRFERQRGRGSVAGVLPATNGRQQALFAYRMTYTVTGSTEQRVATVYARNGDEALLALEAKEPNLGVTLDVQVSPVPPARPQEQGRGCG